MPKAKKSARSKASPRAVAKKAAPKKAPSKRAAPKPMSSGNGKSPRKALDPRAIAAIGLALQDELVAASRADQLRDGLSPWTALGRVRAVGKAR